MCKQTLSDLTCSLTAFSSQEFWFPDDVGFPWYDVDSPEYVRFETHFNNEDQKWVRVQTLIITENERNYRDCKLCCLYLCKITETAIFIINFF